MRWSLKSASPPPTLEMYSGFEGEPDGQASCSAYANDAVSSGSAMSECLLEAESILNTSICYSGMKLSLSWRLRSDEYFLVATCACTMKSNFWKVTPRQVSLLSLSCSIMEVYTWTHLRKQLYIAYEWQEQAHGRLSRLAHDIGQKVDRRYMHKPIGHRR